MKWIVSIIVTWFLDKIASVIKYFFERWQLRKKNEELREKLEEAQTPEEREDAARDIIDNFSKHPDPRI